MRRRFVGASGLASLALLCLGTGCVPYQTYMETKRKLESATEANADVIKKYNQLLQKYALMEKQGGGNQNGALLAELETLREALRNRPVTPGFTQSEIKSVEGAEGEEGGLRLGEALLFTEGSDRLKPEAFRVLDQIVKLLKGDYAGESLIIEGHTDNQPLEKTKGIWGHNMTLGYARAKAVFQYFLDHGIPESRMIVHSYSFNKPVNPTPAGRQENRRVVIRRGGTQI